MRGFSLSSDKATGDQAPATLRLTGLPRLTADSTLLASIGMN
ncbi:hypothetical protein LTSEHVI_0869 [Salmonella enterica subsp. enterica serovar Hvittingfoss str. A4-620]|uniref:Uncharacterized protein n=1 Tax=Salmonella paratyphi B (strain ATCC BAA-1250 / SPB7) TaxID=1016998 RepID=A0A6C6Z510_SALPB|nr:hypothetical protein SPAB_03173 [Salmonella enterica subsp. enterica serovar Paratyphi B str. SPB7]EHC55523.1 hypothetical protein LTSEHVI_0869 [Salmonella enterica subsp. enterica serovar Hvittingfoss str. A4-620]